MRREAKDRTNDADLASIIRHIFIRPIAFHTSLVFLTGSVSAALMLGQACYWDERTNDPDSWFWKTRDEWTAETGLSRWEQEDARKKLRSKGFIQEKLSGVPARNYFRVNFVKIAQAYKKTCKQVGGKTSIQMVGKPPTGRRKNLQLYKGNTKITTKTTTKITAQNDQRKESRVRSDETAGNEQEQQIRFDKRKQLLLSQAEQLLRAENKSTLQR